MVALIFFVLSLVASRFKPKSRLEAENAALRHQVMVLQRKVRGRVHFTNSDRLFFIQLYRWCPSVLKAMKIVRPETVVRWHRVGLRRYWRWKSRSPRRECIDHMNVFNEEHLRRILSKYASYYNEVRTHLALGKDAPCTRPVERFGDIIAQPILGGLHHRYARI